MSDKRREDLAKPSLDGAMFVGLLSLNALRDGLRLPVVLLEEMTAAQETRRRSGDDQVTSFACKVCLLNHGSVFSCVSSTAALQVIIMDFA